MVTLFASHDVSDYEKWEDFFRRGVSQLPKDNGIIEIKAFRTADNGRIVVSHTFNSLTAAEKHQAMLENPDNQAMAAQNGAIFPAELWLVEEIAI